MASTNVSFRATNSAISLTCHRLWTWSINVFCGLIFKLCVRKQNISIWGIWMTNYCSNRHLNMIPNISFIWFSPPISSSEDESDCSISPTFISFKTRLGRTSTTFDWDRIWKWSKGMTCTTICKECDGFDCSSRHHQGVVILATKTILLLPVRCLRKVLRCLLMG